jgi:D-mannonate dehydratase
MLNNDQQNTTQETKNRATQLTTPAKHNKYVVNQNLEHVDDVSFRKLWVELEYFIFTK